MMVTVKNMLEQNGESMEQLSISNHIKCCEEKSKQMNRMPERNAL